MNPTPQVETLTSTQTPAGEEVALEMQGIKQDNASLRRQVQLLRVEVGRRWRGYGGTHPPCGMERVGEGCVRTSTSPIADSRCNVWVCTC